MCVRWVPVVRTQCFYDLKNQANLKSGQPKNYKKLDDPDETTPLKQGRKKWKYDINPKRTPRIGLNWITREQNACFNHSELCTFLTLFIYIAQVST